MKPSTHPSLPQPEMSPIQQGERIQILDILRGFAVFGILAVNIVGFATPAFWPGYAAPADQLWYNEVAARLVQFFAEAKFYTIFSFLFGLGFSVQLGRAAAKGRDIRSFYPRRLWILFGIGIFHAVLFWTGDILRMYALLGFALLAFRSRSNRALIIWTAFFFALSFALLIVFNGQTGGETSGIPGLDIPAMARTAYQSSSYLDVVLFQVFAAAVTFVFMFLTQGPSVMALFLLGLLAGRSRIFEQLPQHRSLARRVLVLGTLTGLAANSLLVFSEVSWQKSLGITLGAPALAAVYTAGLSLLSVSGGGARILMPLARVGRMALTNYVLQSLVCSFLFYGFGLGLYEQVGAGGQLGLALVIYLLQIPLSSFWLSRYQFGPLEWAWRSLTYGKRQPMQKQLYPSTSQGSLSSPAA